MTHTFVPTSFTLDWQSRIEQSLLFHNFGVVGSAPEHVTPCEAAVLNCDQLQATGTSQKQLSDDSPQQTHNRLLRADTGEKK